VEQNGGVSVANITNTFCNIFQGVFVDEKVIVALSEILDNS
jgi:hypothetical protein